MNAKAWLGARGLRYVRDRGERIYERYGFTPGNMQSHSELCVSRLAECGGAPTIFAPASLLERYTAFFRRLDTLGAEIAGHSYSHIDLRQCSMAEAVAQNVRSARVFRELGLTARGFRCPYLSFTEELLAALPPGLFEYSSNRSISWENLLPGVGEFGEPIFDTLERFYHPARYETTLCLPRFQGALVELPVIVPDDLQLLDGLRLEPGRVAGHWGAVLAGTHARGEMFDLIFHVELAGLWADSLTMLVEQAKRLTPPVWVTRLRDVNDWWRERTNCCVSKRVTDGRLALEFECPSRASVLARGIGVSGVSTPWDGVYEKLREPHLELPEGELPFVGIEDVQLAGVRILRQHGYVVETGKEARRCSVVLSPERLGELTNEVELVNFVECAPGPLVKFNLWPDGAKSALAITGDLDAVTLWDYTERLIGH